MLAEQGSRGCVLFVQVNVWYVVGCNLETKSLSALTQES